MNPERENNFAFTFNANSTSDLNAPKLDLELQAELSFRCTSSQVVEITEARAGSELELLRSHPKDERGSVREIGLWILIAPTPHFLELSPTARPLLTCWPKWSFSVPLGGPFRTSFGNHFGPRLETISDRILDRKLTRGDSISNSETSIRTQMRTRQFKLSKSSSAV